MNRDEVSATTHRGVAFANPLSEVTIEGAVATLELPAGARVLDVGCGTGGLLARIAARHDVVTVGVEPSPAWAAVAREHVDEVHEAAMDAVTFAPASFDLVCCIAASHAFGTYDAALAALAGLVRPGGAGLVGEGFWRRAPSAGYLEALGGAEEDELPDHAGLLACARDAGWTVVADAIATDADWAAYEETLIANGRGALAIRHDADLEAWVDAAQARWAHADGQDTLGFTLLTLRRG